MSWMKISWNAHDQRTLWHSDWELDCQVCLFYVSCTSKCDFYILDAPVSNRLITKQGVFFKKRNFMALFYGWSSTASRHFLPLSSQIFLVLILLTSGGWKAESILEPPNGFERGHCSIIFLRMCQYFSIFLNVSSIFLLHLSIYHSQVFKQDF